MKKLMYVLLIFTATAFDLFSQTGTINGTVVDEETKEPLIGVTIFLEGTTLGTVTDFDGNFIVQNVPAGTYDIRCSYISYQTEILEDVEIKANETFTYNFGLVTATVEIGDVKVIAKANRESENVLLLEQKNAEVIVESIGAKRLSELGVSDAASATEKITGVNKSQGSGDIYIRGLGDRYLITTMNNLPIPSDDVAKKNIDLNLFSSDIIQNVSIAKTYSVDNYGDLTSGVVNINSKTLSEGISVGLATGSNTNVLKEFDNFRVTQNYNDLTLGYYSKPFALRDAITDQSWNTGTRSFPIGYDFNIIYGENVELFNKNLSIFATVSHSSESGYETGTYQKFRSNVLDKSFHDVQKYTTEINTTGLLNLAYNFNFDHSLNFNSLYIHKAVDELYEQGRDGQGYVFDQDPQEDGAFERDQNLKVTDIIINQLLGTHNFLEKNELKWAVGYNIVIADEPNRIRNEGNILGPNTFEFAGVSDFHERKSLQEIEDNELSGYIKNITKFKDEEKRKLNLSVGANVRYKKRDFNALSIGVRARGVQVNSIDNLDEALLGDDLYDSGELIIRDRLPDTYQGTLTVFGGFMNLGMQLNKISGNFGLRYEMDEIDVNWNVGNYVGRDGNIVKEYNNLFPSLNLKYDLSGKSAIRLAASKTITLPEFKEIAPFEYVSQEGRVIKGDEDIISSENYNLDVKWEMFPSNGELISASGFVKVINDPINLAMTRGSSGNFFFANTGDQATVYGFELETRIALIKAAQTDFPGLDLTLNATKMWTNQDLLDEFQYNNKTEIELEGAPSFILNGALSFSNNKPRSFVATISGNYTADKIYALGAPESQTSSATLFNNEIIEKGFATLDLVLSKKFSNRISVKLSGKNLLNPEIEQTQKIFPLTDNDPYEATVLSYKKGIYLKLGVTINLNN